MSYFLKNDLWAFERFGWGVSLNPKGTWFSPRVDRPLVRFLEVYGKKWLRKRKYGRAMKLMVIRPRDTAKTVLTTKGFQLWLHTHDPNLSTTTASADRGRAEAFLLAMKAVLDGSDSSALFAKVFGTWRHPLRPWREEYLIHGRRTATAISEPSIGTCSVETGATAYHPDVAFIDDPITVELLNESGNWVKRVNKFLLAMVPVVRKDGLTVFVGTPYEDGDAITTLLRDEGVASVHGMPLPFEFKKGGPWHVFYMSGRAADGTPMFPKVWSEEAMQSYERRSPMDYAAQVLCNPVAGQNRPITPELLKNLWVERHHLPKNMSITIHMDTAWKDIQKMGTGDDSTIVVAGRPQDGSGDVYYLEAPASNRWKVEDQLDELAKIIFKYRSMQPRVHIAHLTDEKPVGKPGLWPNQIRGFLANLNIPMPQMTEIPRQKGPSKPNRLREVAGYWVDGRVKLLRGGRGLEKLAAQMLTLGKPHDDVADAAADAFYEEIYYPMVYRGDSGSKDILPRRPYDDVLQGGAYDPLEDFAARGGVTREPIQ